MYSDVSTDVTDMYGKSELDFKEADFLNLC
jgi:hypothetical protein